MKAGLRAVASAAFAVSLRGKVGTLTALDVEHLRSQAEELLDEGDSLRAAVLEFATQYEVVRRQAPALIDLCDGLSRAVEYALRPAAPDQHRVDIHG
jgi:hypothetical protein